MEIIDARSQAVEPAITDAERAVKILIQSVGEDPTREGLVDTPRRVVKAYRELCAGYSQDPAEILSTQFSEKADEMIVVKDIEFWSLCEHHLLPFTGTATVAYIPFDRVVGLSKIPRVVRCFAQRLQIQERLTQQIADAVDIHLNALGSACVIRASHTCMQMRGVQSTGEMTTSCLRGLFRNDQSSRSEFLALARS